MKWWWKEKQKSDHQMNLVAFNWVSIVFGTVANSLIKHSRTLKPFINQKNARFMKQPLNIEHISLECVSLTFFFFVSLLKFKKHEEKIDSVRIYCSDDNNKFQKQTFHCRLQLTRNLDLFLL